MPVTKADRMLIGGALVASDGGAWDESRNPANEEIIGPVLSLMKWRTVEEAVAMANSTEYGLNAAIWTNDLDTAFKTARRVRSGYQWINGPIAESRVACAIDPPKQRSRLL